MPADVIYQYAFPSYGTIGTCEAQAFIYNLGAGSVVMLGLILNLYYLCKLRYNMEDAVFRQKIEPYCYVFLLLPVVLADILVLRQDGFNPALTDSHCTHIEYPDDCNNNEESCRGYQVETWVRPFKMSVLIIAMLSLVISMALIVHSFSREEKKHCRHSGSMNSQDAIDPLTAEQIKQARASRNTVTKQAIMYFAAIVLTWMLTLVSQGVIIKSAFVVFMRAMLQPLHGFFNMLIFFYHKIHTLRKCEGSLTVPEALSRLMMFPEDVPEIVAVENIEFVMTIQSLNHNRRENNQDTSVPFNDPFQSDRCLSGIIKLSQNDEASENSDISSDGGLDVYRRNLPMTIASEVRRVGSHTGGQSDLLSTNSKSLGGFDIASEPYALQPIGEALVGFDSSKADSEFSLSSNSKSLGGFDDEHVPTSNPSNKYKDSCSIDGHGDEYPLTTYANKESI